MPACVYLHKRGVFGDAIYKSSNFLSRPALTKSAHILFTIALPIVAMLQLHPVAIALLTATAAAATAVRRDNPSSCSNDVSTTDAVRAILDDPAQSPSERLEKDLNDLPDKEQEWVNKLWDKEFPGQGSSPYSGCSFISGQCPRPHDCSQYSSPARYWIFNSVYVLSSKLNTVNNHMMWDGLLDGLSIDQIGRDFSQPNPDQGWQRWVSAAFSVAGILAPVLGAPWRIAGGTVTAGPMFTMAGGAFQMLNADGGTTSGAQVDTTSVKNALKSIIQAAAYQVGRMLQCATGNGDSSDIAGGITEMAPKNFHFNTSKFFADPGILYDQDKDKSSFFAQFDYSLSLVVSGALSFCVFGQIVEMKYCCCRRKNSSMWLCSQPITYWLRTTNWAKMAASTRVLFGFQQRPSPTASTCHFRLIPSTAKTVIIARYVVIQPIST